MEQNVRFKKIRKDEFDRLKRLFPSGEDTWKKYRGIRLGLLEDHKMDIFVAEAGADVIGELTVSYTSDELQSETVPGLRVYLSAYRVEAAHRGRGIGQKLLDYVLKAMEAEGYTEFTIGVEDDNEVAKHIYFKYGFADPIDHGDGDEFDPTAYTLYLRRK